ncbi:MAG: endonuclease/exonuclease/phosphatase family protein [Anaerotignum sp.]|nr:endonuclease/exonuclease/phosphatase family protein [Anaerotignum sp.]
MKLLTLNTHSLHGSDWEQKLEWFVEGVLQEKPDIIALQEVNQTITAQTAENVLKEGQTVVSELVQVKQDNFAAQAAYRLRKMGMECFWAWLPVKVGYEKYDEGAAILSIGRKIRKTAVFPISKTWEYQDWRTRAVLGVQVEGCTDWFYTVHMGWWQDKEEPFSEQWEKLMAQIKNPSAETTVWLMGDFNAPDIFSDQSYAHICKSGWQDTHITAKEKGNDFTAAGGIDGWKDILPDEDVKGLRLDYIWCKPKQEILSSDIVFNGERGHIISDHFGVIVEAKERGR